MKKIFKIFFILSIFLVVAGLFFIAYAYFQVSREVSREIRSGIIQEVTASESPVYYDDGTTILGVFFDKNHQKYVHFNEIPDHFVNALVATEDERFFNHYGFDLMAVFRAAIYNARAGRIVQGGSTITQQTAKNLFRRQRRSYGAKFRELLQAVCLERRFKKEEILELYVNQFHVTGAGRGIGIAAKYFFNKEVKDLDLVESAFIAGAIKGPNLFNPFTKKSEEAKRMTLVRAENRKNYVLSQMLELKFITRDQYEDNKKKEVPFQGGKITYGLNVILDYIQKQLQNDYFKSVFHEQGIDNLATSGIQIHTSINKEMQAGALKSLRRHLSLLDTSLTGYDRRLINETYLRMHDNRLDEQKPGFPVLARITGVNTDKEKPLITVSWDKGEGIIDFEETRSFYDALVKSRSGTWAQYTPKHLSSILRLFQEGDPVAVHLSEPTDETAQPKLSLTKIPELQGGIVILGDGMIKAMVGGYFNHFLNRAVDSKRQLGSIFKPVVYTAALQLKWNNLGPLMNMKSLFRFEDTYYIPKPDHDPVADRISMAWAGAKSENLASVWLLYHLIDQLNPAELRRLAQRVGLGIKESGSSDAYRQRLRDDHGIMITEASIMESAFEESKREIESDLIFSGQDVLLPTLMRLRYTVDKNHIDSERDESGEISRLSFQRLQSMNQKMKIKWKTITTLLKDRESLAGGRKEALDNLLSPFCFESRDRNFKIIFTPDRFSSGVPLTSEVVDHYPGEVQEKNVWIDNLLPSAVLDLIQFELDKRFKDIKACLTSQIDTIFRIRDFRSLLGLLYVVQLAKEMGISTRLDPVLSFPLGANAISILEAALVYQTIVTGRVYPFTETKTTTMVPIITKITDRYGETIWEYQEKSEKVLSEKVSTQASEILRLAVEEGTGQIARNAVKVRLVMDEKKIDFPVIIGGKTGTSNDCSNSSFVGFIPGPSRKTGKPERSESYIISCYVGYDDNRPMKSKTITLYGSSGALPIWVDAARALVNSPNYQETLQPAEIIFDSQAGSEQMKNGLVPVIISRVDGLPLGMNGTENGKVNYPQILSDQTSNR